jgi:aminopeptidase N
MGTMNSEHKTIYRHDYRAPDFLIEKTDLLFELGEATTIVTSTMQFKTVIADSVQPLVLDGHRFLLLGIKLDGQELSPERYSVSSENLTIHEPPAEFQLEVRTELKPQENTFLEGLYRSGGMFCTQCEAEGFRSITYYPDRPDFLTVFTTTIIADKQLYPVLLSNGNLVEQHDLTAGRHLARWHDPFRKPSYLFAMVAGNLASIHDTFTTCSGRQVALSIYVNQHNIGKCDHAMRSLKKAMRWDEEVYGREYDLDCFMIVAVDDFNMGAMENKGLNIFNSRYVLASPETATDDNYQAIEEVIGHEYFHNWSGNRVTCRDWFQLSLKEGFTIFRDQEFSADMQSRGVKRISDVRDLRTSQFAEDGGPMAHPVRPDSYMEINNFYTLTVYNKGGELVRMLHTILGKELFRKGTDLYFNRFDGQAVTVDDFVQAMSEASGFNLDQFSLWYSQAGTPRLKASSAYDQSTGVYIIRFSQSCPATPGQAVKKPFLIPVAIGLLDKSGKGLPVTQDGEVVSGQKSRVLLVADAEQEFRFSGLSVEPVPVLLRGFSAPVILEYDYSHEELVLLASHEKDPFCRWEACQKMATQVILNLVADCQAGRGMVLDDRFSQAFGSILTSGMQDRGLLAEMLELPSEKYLAELMEVVDPQAIFDARQFVIKTLASIFRTELLELRRSCQSDRPYSADDGRSGERRLGNLCLSYLMSLKEQSIIDLCMEQYGHATNMTDSIGAIGLLVSCDSPERMEALGSFYDRWKEDRQVLDKWFALQAVSKLPTVLGEITGLLSHPDFELSNPNRFRSLVGTFSQANQVRFHAADGSGYRFLADQLIHLIPINPQVSARLLAPLTLWRRFEENRQKLMRRELERISSLENLPRDVYEVVFKSLG